MVGRFAARFLLAGTCLLALGATSASAATAPVASGEYEGAPVVESGHTYQIASFAVSRENGKHTMTASEQYDGIFYPDVGKCDNFELPLVADNIPISSTGRFKIKEKTPVEDTAVTVNWKGHWTKAKRVAGTITIKFDGCTSTEDWTGHKVG